MTPAAMLQRLFGVVLLACILPAAHAQMIAKLESVQGVVAVEKRAGRPTVGAAGTGLSAGDIVSTMKNSTALLVFTDRSQIAMRPESKLTVPEYSFEEANPDGDGMVVNLIKGGMRALSGLIGKRGNMNALKVAAAGATIGVQGADFIARVCANDCGPETRGREPARPATSASGGVGKIDAVHGTVTATLAGATRTLALNKVVFEGDVLESADASSVLVLFSDLTQFLLKPRTKAEITAYNYDRQRIDQNRMTVNMSSGGGQVTTGQIGKLNPQGVQVIAPQAYIGVRGTRFDFACAATGSHEAGGVATTVCSGGLYVHVSEGRVGVRTGDQVGEFGPGQTAYVPRVGEPAVRLTTVPRIVSPVPVSRGQSPAAAAATQPASERSSSEGKTTPASGTATDPGTTTTPATDTTTTTTATSTTTGTATSSMVATSSTTASAPTQGLLISSNEGNVVLTRGGEQVVIPRGETGLLGAVTTPMVRLPVSPPVIDADPFLTSVKFLDASCFQ